MEHFDVVIVGAGLSGIGAAVHLQTQCPGKTYAILEGRDAIGGTWDLFRYPGIRSDSDMYTLGYAFKPWTQAKAIADGPSILNYVRETAREHGIDPHIRYGHKVLSAAWSTPDAAWTVTAEQDGQTRTFTCNFLFLCGGYYSYDGGYTPDFPGAETFKGRIVHPQNWPSDLD
ncbi:MAG TPA: NAD(P)/FAD-dependent oxidoreductase, partial [Phenylobacterium sp.]|nr:NAD(P)/FAD-dependent oxidoreductase [Phenylobacterium sp.]